MFRLTLHVHRLLLLRCCLVRAFTGLPSDPLSLPDFGLTGNLMRRRRLKIRLGDGQVGMPWSYYLGLVLHALLTTCLLFRCCSLLPLTCDGAVPPVDFPSNLAQRGRNWPTDHSLVADCFGYTTAVRLCWYWLHFLGAAENGDSRRCGKWRLAAAEDGRPRCDEDGATFWPRLGSSGLSCRTLWKVASPRGYVGGLSVVGS